MWGKWGSLDVRFLRFKNSEFVMKVFAPNRKNSSYQEMVGQYLRGLSMGNLFWVLGTGFWVLGTGFWVLGSNFKV